MSASHQDPHVTAGRANEVTIFTRLPASDVLVSPTPVARSLGHGLTPLAEPYDGLTRSGA